MIKYKREVNKAYIYFFEEIHIFSATKDTDHITEKNR